MKRISFMLAAAVLMLAMLPATAMAQGQGEGRGPECPPGAEAPYQGCQPPANGTVTHETPCGTFTTPAGSFNQRPSTTLRANCQPGGPNNTPAAPRSNAVPTGRAIPTGFAEVDGTRYVDAAAEDGSWTARLEVPESAEEEFEVIVTSDLTGEFKTLSYTIPVEPVSDFTMGAAESDDGGTTSTIAIAALMAALLLALGFNWPSLLSRVRR